MSNKIKYLANRRMVIEKNKQKEIDLNKNNLELHHIIGRKNSNEKICLCNPCHDYISCVQNGYPVKVRKEKELMALLSLKGLFELGLKHLSELIEFKVNKISLSKLK